MPIADISIPTGDKPISQTVIYSIKDTLLKMMNLSEPEITLYTGDTNTKSNKSRDLVAAGDSRLFLNVKEVFLNDELGTSAVNISEVPPIFFDSNLDVVIRPIYANTEVEMEFEYITHSQTEAEMWKNNHYVNVTRLREVILHDLHYHYPLPFPFVKLLNTIHEYRNNIAPYNDSFKDYMVKHSTDKLTLLSNLKGSHSDFSFAETQARVVGRFASAPLVEKADKDEQTGTYSVKLQYMFTYLKPIAMSIKYPPIVHQQVLPSEYLDHLLPENHQELDLNNPSFHKSLGALHHFEDARMSQMEHYKSDDIINIPEYDSFYPTYGHKEVLDLVNILIEIEPEDPTYLLNLKDLGDMALSEELLTFLSETDEYERITNRYESFIHITVIEGDYRIRHELVTCDKDLNLRLTKKPDLRKPYRVRFGLMTELHYWHERAWKNISNNPEIFVALCACVNPSIEDLDIVKHILTQKKITRQSRLEIMSSLRTRLNGRYMERPGYKLV